MHKRRRGHCSRYSYRTIDNSIISSCSQQIILVNPVQSMMHERPVHRGLVATRRQGVGSCPMLSPLPRTVPALERSGELGTEGGGAVQTYRTIPEPQPRRAAAGFRTLLMYYSTLQLDYGCNYCVQRMLTVGISLCRCSDEGSRKIVRCLMFFYTTGTFIISDSPPTHVN